MHPIEPKHSLKLRKTNSKNKNLNIVDNYLITSNDLEKAKMNYFKIDLSSKSNNKSKNKNNNSKSKHKKSEKNKIFNTSYIDMALMNYEKGYYQISLGYALQSIENNEKYNMKANYVILLCYLHMFDFDKN